MQLERRQQVLDLNHVVDAVGDDALDGVAQLGEIARPRQRAEQRERRLREACAAGRPAAAHASSSSRTASAGTSSGRSRSGGRSMRTAESRR